MNRTIAAGPVAVAVAASLVACGSGNSDDTPTTVTSPADETSVTSTEQLGTVDQVKLSAFVAAFRARYSELSQDRGDASIDIVIDSCNELANGADEEQVTEKIRILAANNTTQPTQDEAAQIYDMVTPACP